MNKNYLVAQINLTQVTPVCGGQISRLSLSAFRQYTAMLRNIKCIIANARRWKKRF
jgi:hypothetical protein